MFQVSGTPPPGTSGAGASLPPQKGHTMTERSERAKRMWQNPEYRAKHEKRHRLTRLCKVYARLFVLLDAGRRRNPKMASPNGLERWFDAATGSEVYFVGDGSLWLTLPNGRRKNPDFKVLGQARVVELFGDRWHRELRYTDPEALIEMFWRLGIECLVLWESQIQEDKERIPDLVKDFIGC